MNKGKIVLRVLLGIIYFVFGLNGFLQFLPQPPMPAAAGAFVGALGGSGYFFPVLKATEVIGGLMLLTGFYVPLFLIVLAPITLQIVLFHAFLAPEGMFLQVGMLLIHLSLGWLYRSSYRELLKAK